MKSIRTVLSASLFAFLSINIFSQAVVKDSRGLVVTDYENRTVILPRDATRIIPLVPSALRILVQVGADDRIVAVDRKSAAAKANMLPFLSKPALAKLPIVGDRKEPNLESILALNPDLVVTSSTADKADALQRALGVPVICVVSEPDEDYDIIRLLGTVAGKKARAEELVAYLSIAAEELEAKVATIPPSERKRVYLGLFTNSGRFTQTMPVYQSLMLAGGINVAGEVPASTSWGSVEINKERIIAWDPEVVFVDWRETAAYLPKEGFLADADFAALSAVRKGKVHYSQTSHDGKDYAAALAEACYMASVLYPDAVSPEYAADVAEKAYGLSGYYAGWTARFGIE